MRGNGIREHVYYRCANNNPGPDHPRVRWRAEDLEQAVIDDLSRLRMPSEDVAEWFREALQAAFADLGDHQRRQRAALKKRRTELANMQDRLLNAYLAGTVDEEAFRVKIEQLRAEARQTEEALERIGEHGPVAVRRGPGGIRG